jgi:hypothetical protein
VSAAQFVVTTFDGAVATVSLSRPERHNAFNDEMVEQFAAALAALHDDTDVRAVVLRGDGKSFSSGRDTKVLSARAMGETDLEFVARAQQTIGLISTMPVPMIAALEGWVLGGSFENLALVLEVQVIGPSAAPSGPFAPHPLRFCDDVVDGRCTVALFAEEMPGRREQFLPRVLFLLIPKRPRTGLFGSGARHVRLTLRRLWSVQRPISMSVSE